jgi:hypothetical protein
MFIDLFIVVSGEEEPRGEIRGGFKIHAGGLVAINTHGQAPEEWLAAPKPAR